MARREEAFRSDDGKALDPGVTVLPNEDPKYWHLIAPEYASCFVLGLVCQVNRYVIKEEIAI